MAGLRRLRDESLELSARARDRRSVLEESGVLTPAAFLCVRDECVSRGAGGLTVCSAGAGCRPLGGAARPCAPGSAFSPSAGACLRPGDPCADPRTGRPLLAGGRPLLADASGRCTVRAPTCADPALRVRLDLGTCAPPGERCGADPETGRLRRLVPSSGKEAPAGPGADPAVPSGLVCQTVEECADPKITPGEGGRCRPAEIACPPGFRRESATACVMSRRVGGEGRGSARVAGVDPSLRIRATYSFVKERRYRDGDYDVHGPGISGRKSGIAASHATRGGWATGRHTYDYRWRNNDGHGTFTWRVEE